MTENVYSPAISRSQSLLSLPLCLSLNYSLCPLLIAFRQASGLLRFTILFPLSLLFTLYSSLTVMYLKDLRIASQVSLLDQCRAQLIQNYPTVNTARGLVCYRRYLQIQRNLRFFKYRAQRRAQSPSALNAIIVDRTNCHLSQ